MEQTDNYSQQEFNKVIVDDVTFVLGQYSPLYIQTKEHQIVISHVCKGLLEIVGYDNIAPAYEDSPNDEHPVDWD